MTAEIIDITARRSAAREKSDRPTFYVTGSGDAVVLAGRDHPWTADELKQIAQDLRFMARHLEGDASEVRGIDRVEVLGDIQIHSDSCVRFWLHDAVETAEQMEWMLRRLDDARGLYWNGSEPDRSQTGAGSEPMTDGALCGVDETKIGLSVTNGMSVNDKQEPKP